MDKYNSINNYNYIKVIPNNFIKTIKYENNEKSVYKNKIEISNQYIDKSIKSMRKRNNHKETNLIKKNIIILF